MAAAERSIALFDPGLLGEPMSPECSSYPMDCPAPFDTGEYCDYCRCSAPTPSSEDDSTNISSNGDQSMEQSETDGEVWRHIPAVILERIFRSMTYCERLRVSSTCKHWRSLLYSPRLWTHIDLSLVNIREGKKAYFLTKCIRFAKYVRIHWPALITRGQVGRIRPMDLHNKETLKSLLQAMRECKNLRVLVLKLENPCAFSPDFSQPVQDSMRVICNRNSNLIQLSFGCNATIIPPVALDLLTDLPELQELHIARYKPSYSVSNMDAVPVLCADDLVSFSRMIGLKELTIDWCNVSPGVVQGLTRSASSLSKFNIIVSSHNCTHSAHPSAADWERFALTHVAVRVSLTFVRQICGACNSLKLIQPAVHLLKVLECSYIDPEDYLRVLGWLRDSLQALVHVGKWDNIELETGPSLWPSVSSCFGLKHLAFIGHFILDEILLLVTSHFVLKSLVITKPHIMMFEEALPYLLPASACKYNQFKQEVSAILQQPWEATNQVPLEGFYFAEGKDDSVYLAES